MKVLITHVDMDGFGGNILNEIFKDYLNFDSVYNLNYGFEFTSVINEFLNPEVELYIMDLSVEEKIFIEWSNILKSLRIFDHHVSSKYLSKYDACSWDEKRSGTKIFYEDYVYPIVKDKVSNDVLNRVKLMVELISTYDIWQDNSPLWKDAVRLNRLNIRYGKKFIKYASDKILNNNINDWDESDLAIFESEEKEEDEYLDKMEKGFLLRTDNEGMKFILTEIPKKAKLSMVSYRLLKNHPELDYAIIKCPYLESYSLRTRKDIDLTEMLHGCFGHAKACGCHIDPAYEPYVYLSEWCPKHIKEGERKSKMMILEKVKSF